MAKNRKNIPENIRRKIWAESAGRCEFRACNKHLWYNDLTGKITPFGELAHIIGASRSGPRGRWNSVDIQNDSSNLMLLCEKCHKEIDYGRNISEYPPSLLREMKREHEERVRLLLDTPRNKTTVVIFTCPIKGNLTPIQPESVYNATLPDYPDSPSDMWHKIKVDSFDYSESNWKYVKSLIDLEADKLSKKSKSNNVHRLSIFGIGPMPLLFYLGFKIPDTFAANVYNASRNAPPEHRFTWLHNENTTMIVYKFKSIKIGNSKKVLILLSLSDYIAGDKYINITSANDSVYELTIDNPSPMYITKRMDLELFKRSFRELLNDIQKKHGKDCEINLFPAVPACIAITAGRTILPTKDPKINIYEYFNGVPEIVLSLP